MRLALREIHWNLPYFSCIGQIGSKMGTFRVLFALAEVNSRTHSAFPSFKFEVQLRLTC